LSSSGQCCPPGSNPDPKTGMCKGPPDSCPATQMSSSGVCCTRGATPNNVSGGCCPPGLSPAPGSGVCQPVSCPPPGKMVGVKCCLPTDLQPGGTCATCPPDQMPVGASNFCCDRSLIYTDRTGVQACCRDGKLANGRCQPTTSHGVPALPQCTPGAIDPKCCASGYQPVANKCCLTGQMTSQGLCCPLGQTPSGPNKDRCQPIRVGWHPPGSDGNGGTRTGDGDSQCCVAGLVSVADGSCCAPNQVTAAGVCCPAGQRPDPKSRFSCVPTTACNLPAILVSGACCPSNRIYKDASGRQQCCPQDMNQGSGRCEVTQLRPLCATGYTEMPDGSCCSNRLVSADGRACRERPGRVPIPIPVPVPVEPGCGPGRHKDPRSGVCVSDGECPKGMRRVGGSCVGTPPTTTARPRLVCRAGQVPNAAGTACITLGRRPPSGRVESKKPGSRIVVPTKRTPSSKRAPVPPPKGRTGTSVKAKRVR
jgi:hypothetical protein